MPTLREKWKNAFSRKKLDSVRRDTHAVSVMFQRLDTDAIRDKKDNRPLLHQKRRHRLTRRYPQKVHAAEMRTLLEQEERFRADMLLGESVCIRHVFFGTLPCIVITSLNHDAHMAKNCRFRHVGVDVQPSRESKKSGVKCSVASLKESFQLACVSRASHPRKSVLRKEEKMDQITPSNSPRTRDTTSKFGKETVHGQAPFLCANPHERNPCAPKFEEKAQDEATRHDTTRHNAYSRNPRRRSISSLPYTHICTKLTNQLILLTLPQLTLSTQLSHEFSNSLLHILTPFPSVTALSASQFTTSSKPSS